MTLRFEAIYENGTLKLEHPLPLAEHQRVNVVIEEATSIARESYGMMGWHGDAETLRKIALQPEFGTQESP